MAEQTRIAWTDSTFNPWLGCSRVSAGCLHCYAEQLIDRRMGKAKWGPAGTRVRTSDSYWRQPINWNKAAAAKGKRRLVFCCSLADVFEDWRGHISDSHGNVLWMTRRGVAVLARQRLDFCGERVATMDDVRAELFRLIDATPALTWLLLTKRPENIRRMWQPIKPRPGYSFHLLPGDPEPTYRSNVWLGCSPCDQKTFNQSAPHLSFCADLCSCLFLSAEPLIGEVDIGCFLSETGARQQWVIVGGESSQGGNNARPCRLDWVRSLVRQCKKTSTPCFVKQLGSHPLFNRDEATLFLQDRAGADPEEWPADLRVREFPPV